MDVADQFQQVGVRIDQKRFEPPLEKMSGALFAPIEILRVAKGKVLDDFRQRNLRDLHGKMDVIVHEAVGVNTVLVALDSRLKKQQESGSIRAVGKDGVATVAAQHHVVKGAGIVDARLAGHGERVA